ncbi:MAG: PAS domain-containing protein [Rhodocyclaceae bacterium]|nr:PAS domain-containing protein [Rhodocyclaceae bacterium]
MLPSFSPSLRALWLVLGLALLAISGLIAFDLVRGYREVLLHERDHLVHQTTIVEATLSGRLETTSNGLKALRDELPGLLAQPNGVKAVNRQMELMAVAMAGIRTFALINPRGELIASNRPELIGTNFRGTERYETIRRDHDPSKLYVTAPFKTPLGNFTIGLARALNGRAGDFNGYLMAIVDPAYFSVLLDSVLYTADMNAGLIHGDGRIVYRLPKPEAVAGKDLSTDPSALFLRHAQSRQFANVYVGLAIASGEQRLVAFRNVRPASVPSDKPLVVSASRSLSAIYAPWLREAYIKGSLFGAMALISILGLLAYQRRALAYADLQAMQDAERQRSEGELRESAERFRMFMDNSPTITWIKDDEGRHVYLSRTYEQRFGVRLEDWRGKTDLEVWPEPIARKFRQNDLVVLAADKSMVIVEETREADGRTVYWLNSKFPFRDAAGHRYVAGIGLDVTESREQEAALRSHRDRLVEALAAEQRLRDEQVRFIDTISHEYRTPLSVVKTNLDILHARQSIEDRRYAVMDGALRRLSEIFSNALHASRLGRPPPPRFAPLDLEALTIEALTEFRQASPDCPIHSLTMGIPVMIRGDAELVRTALRNVLENAGKYRFPATEDGVVTMSLSVDGPMAVFAVTNPIDPSQPLQRGDLFERYVRGNTHSGRSGMGLGLYLVRRIAHDHGGEAVILDGGNDHFTLQVRLPVAAEAASMSDGATEPELQEP